MKRSADIMKKIIFTFSLIIIYVSILGQNSMLISPNMTKDISDNEVTAILKKSSAYISVYFVNVDFLNITDYEYFAIQFGEENITVQKERIDIRGVNNFCFTGKDIVGNSTVISFLQGDIQGIIETDDGVYSIQTIGENDYVVIKVDQSQLVEGCENISVSTDTVSISDNINIQDSVENIGQKNVDNDILSQLSNSYGCKIRVLVLYTSNAQSSVSNIKNTILNAVDITNQSFINSDIDYRMELAYAGLTNYTETNSTTDKNRLRNTNDGYMDEVHALRNKYSADVCVLLAYYTDGICGEAYTIGASAANAFCVVSTYGTCASSYYSFGHEIGHLLGCRHDPYVDNTSTPFAYGHGYIPPSKNWRTIMAYGNGCSGCIRKQFWSNPYKTYNGVSTGTTGAHNNSRVWNEQSNTIMVFRQPASNVTLTNSDISNSPYADIIAKQNITTSGTVNVNSNQTLHLIAGNSITLQPGFVANEGSLLTVKIEDIYDCGTSTRTAKVIVENKDNEFEAFSEAAKPIVKNRVSHKVYPNPSNEVINIEYSLFSNDLVSIEIVDMLGKRLKTIVSNQNQVIGTYNYQIPVFEFIPGTYFLIFSTEKEYITKKIIINN